MAVSVAPTSGATGIWNLLSKESNRGVPDSLVGGGGGSQGSSGGRVSRSSQEVTLWTNSLIVVLLFNEEFLKSGKLSVVNDAETLGWNIRGRGREKSRAVDSALPVSPQEGDGGNS